MTEDINAAVAMLLKRGYGTVAIKAQDHKVVDIKVELDFNIGKGEKVELPVR